MGVDPDRMRVRHTRRPLPRNFQTHPKARGRSILCEYDLSLTRRSRLRAKLLVFERTRDLRRFWKSVLGKGDLGPGCLGAVNQLGEVVTSFKPGASPRSYWRCDPRYFAVIGLCRQHLTMDVITHEAVHVGFAHLARARAVWWRTAARENSEEWLAYPAGIAASAIVGALRAEGLLPH